jgi:hypothetical protein
MSSELPKTYPMMTLMATATCSAIFGISVRNFRRGGARERRIAFAAMVRIS